MCTGFGLIGLLGAAKRWMLSFADRPFSLWPFRPLVPLDIVPFGTAEGAIVVEFQSVCEIVSGFWCLEEIAGERCCQSRISHRTCHSQ